MSQLRHTKPLPDKPLVKLTMPKAMIEPHCMGNDFWRKAMILVGACGI